jgi:hypothetical protein
MEIRQSSLNFPTIVDEGPQEATVQLSFPRAVEAAVAGLIGYSATFEGDDHHLGRLIVELRAEINAGDPTKVDVTGTLGLRDWSNEWDDRYGGLIDFALFAQLEPAGPPAAGEARGDLIVTDAEITQAIQHFRSSKHLDAANVFPDNSIGLVASKPTAVRLYVDYDAGSGLAPIATLSGTMQVTTGATVVDLSPLETIVPRRDSAIDRRRRGHTLNFLIPEGLCQGAVEIVARVFDRSDSAQFSADFSRSLTFEAQPDLAVLAVGIEYTGPDVRDATALAAPTMADFLPVFGLTEALYPIPAVTITNYLTMTYDEEVNSDINDGCDKLGDLKDAVADMRGDSDDIVYGLYNEGVETGSVGGCGSGGAAVGRIGRQGTAAHELGHALGRDHAPCDNVTRCAEPKNTDGGYPHYHAFDSDSIGEYGFDTRSATGSIKDPAVAHDIMGYSGDRWISPYTYKALMSRIPETFGADGASVFASFAGGSRRGGDRGCWIPIKQPKLFLRLDIDRDRSVRLQPAFHFPARPRPHGNKPTDFILELQDGKGRVLRQSCLFSDNSCCGGCCPGGSWPLRIRQAIAFDPAACSLVLYECDEEIYRWPISAPPVVRLGIHRDVDRQSADIEIGWQAWMPGDEQSCDLWYLVQWCDRFGTWRGLAPRTRETRLVVPKRIFSGERRSMIRVLASAGIATGEAVWEGTIVQADQAPGPPATVALVGIEPPAAGAIAIGSVLRASLLTGSGATVSGAGLRWYDGKGGEIARGRSLDLAGLPVGQHRVTARSLDRGGGAAAGTWLVERCGDGGFLLVGGAEAYPPATGSGRRRKPAKAEE